MMPWHIEEAHESCSGFAVVKDDDGSVAGCHDSREEAISQLAALYVNEGRGSERPPMEERRASVVGVDVSQRLIEVVAVPYEEEAVVEYRGELWLESFLRGSFDGVEKRTDRIPVNRDHDDARTVGKAVALHPSRLEGLVGEVRIAPTPLGDETLTLADEDVLGASVWFGVRGSDQILARPYRRIKRAFLGHIAFVPSPAYQGARVLAVRDKGQQRVAADLPKLVTPHLDEIRDWMKSRATQ